MPEPLNPNPFEFAEVICLALDLEKRFVGVEAARVVYALTLLQATYIVSAAEATGQETTDLTAIVTDQVRRYVDWLGTDSGDLYRKFAVAFQTRH